MVVSIQLQRYSENSLLKIGPTELWSTSRLALQTPGKMGTRSETRTRKLRTAGKHRATNFVPGPFRTFSKPH